MGICVILNTYQMSGISAKVLDTVESSGCGHNSVGQRTLFAVPTGCADHTFTGLYGTVPYLLFFLEARKNISEVEF